MVISCLIRSNIFLRQLDDLAGKVEEYERLLQDISSRVGGWDHEMIRRALDRVYQVARAMRK